MNHADKDLLASATTARAFAYAPYSHFQVGAAVRLTDGRIFTGVNVENSAYPLGTCAERNAIAAAVRGGMKPGDLAVVGVVADAPAVVSPCGGCRQVIIEFSTATTRVLLHNLRDSQGRETTAHDLLPHAFGPASLPTP